MRYDDPKADPRAAAATGRHYQRKVGAELMEGVKINAAAMIAGLEQRLGRPASVYEQTAAAGICSLHVRAARMRALGKNDVELLKQAAEMERESIFRHPAAVQAKD